MAISPTARRRLDAANDELRARLARASRDTRHRDHADAVAAAAADELLRLAATLPETTRRRASDPDMPRPCDVRSRACEEGER